ncbi:MAG: hypothetical protein M1814_003921 [Vezdaea aestivalis]|nr:MAG: hypothetical protein M1814_003921 [Vezdaea aestivalis]
MASTSIKTPFTSLLGIRHPIVLAGMAKASGASLAAAVSNAGGLGVIGGLGYTPAQLRDIILDLKSQLSNPSLPFGVDLALPQVGGGARATNHDYTNGRLDDLIDVVVEAGAKIFVSAVGVPPKRVIERLHQEGILIMNMVGAPHHASKALQCGVDVICAQGGEGGGHTGTFPSSILVPAVVDITKSFKSPITGEQPLVIAAGAIYDGRGLASALMQGATAVWVGTRFVASTESGASNGHKKAIVAAGHGDTETTLVITGRPLRVLKNDYVRNWEENRAGEMERMLQAGIIPFEKDLDEGKEVDPPFLMGMVASMINDIRPAAEIVESMVMEAEKMLERGASYARRKTLLVKL